MDDLPDNERLRLARERALRAAEATAAAEARLVRRERDAAAAVRRLRHLQAWWVSRRGRGVIQE